MVAVGIREAHDGRVDAGNGKDAPREPFGLCRVARDLADVEHFELGLHADALRMRPAREWPLRLRRRLRLDGQHPARDLVDVSRFRGVLPLESRRIDVFRDERHVKTPSKPVRNATRGNGRDVTGLGG